MSRSIPAAILTALGQPEVYPFYAVEMLFDSGAIRLWTGYTDRGIGETIAASAIQSGKQYVIKAVGTLEDRTHEIIEEAVVRRSSEVLVLRRQRGAVGIVEQQRDITTILGEIGAYITRTVELAQARSLGTAILERDTTAVHIVAQDRVNNARHRIGAVKRCGTVAQHLNALDAEDRDRVGVVSDNRRQ